MQPSLEPLDASAAPSIELLYSTAHYLHERGRYADAADVFRLMLGFAPTDERTWLGLGECHERIDQLQIALELYSAGSVVAHPAGRCLLARGRLLKRLAQPAEATDTLEAAARLAEQIGDEELMRTIEHEVRRPE